MSCEAYAIKNKNSGAIWRTTKLKSVWAKPGYAKLAYHCVTGKRFDDQNDLVIVRLVEEKIKKLSYDTVDRIIIDALADIITHRDIDDVDLLEHTTHVMAYFTPPAEFKAFCEKNDINPTHYMV